MTNLIGTTLGKYYIVARLGQGGMATVYKAYQPGLNRYVAIKMMSTALTGEPDAVKRFEREAMAVAQLRHPNIMAVYDFDMHAGQYFLVVEYIDGPTLRDELAARIHARLSFSLPETSRIMTALAGAIDYAHAEGIIHRDLKPANIMLTRRGNVVLTDFGVARLTGDSSFTTTTGMLTGTPAYMSPEQGEGKKADARSDVYSLGVILYEIVAGQIPFEADTPFAVIIKHMTDPLPPATNFNPDLPPAVEQVLEIALSKNPDDRYQTAGALAEAFQTAVGASPNDTLTTYPITALAPPPSVEELPPPAGSKRLTPPAGTSPPQPEPAPGKPSRPRWLWPATGGLVAVALLAAAIIVGVGRRPQPQAGQTAQPTTDRAATATQTWLAADDDRDGLSNGRELELNTLPGKRDTDEDDLDDGAEVLKRGTDPLNPDTDDDGLKDGLEFSRGLNPLSSDTDSDGIPDARDPDPGRMPTDTPAPTDTPVPPTPTPASTEVPQVVAAAQGSYVRGGPGESYDVVGGLQAGQRYPVVLKDATGTWLRLAGESERWIPVELVAPEADLSAIPVAARVPPTVTPTLTPAPTATPVPPTATPTPPLEPLAGKIAVELSNTGQPGVYLLNPTTGQRTKLVAGGTLPSLSADGSRIAWLESSGVVRLNLTTGQRNQISQDIADRAPGISHTGEQVAYLNHQALYVWRQGISVRITQANEDPAWSPDGEWVVYSGFENRLFKIKIETDLRPPLELGVRGMDPAWGSNGKIAFEWEGDIYVVNDGGSNRRQLTTGPAADSDPAWSPDGSKLVFVSDRDGNPDLYVINADGGNLRRLTRTPEWESSPSWGQ